MVIENSHKKKQNLRTVWMEYNKAFDSVPHNWMLKALDICKVMNLWVRKLWIATLFLNHTKRSIKSVKINAIAESSKGIPYPHYLIDSGLFTNEQKWSLKNVATTKLTCHRQTDGFTTKRSMIVCLIHGFRNILKRSKYHLSYANFSRSICMWKKH